MMRDPEFIHLEGEVSVDIVRMLLAEMVERDDTTKETRMLFGRLATLHPATRLTRNMGSLLSCLEHVNVSEVLHNGLLRNEKEALLELDDLKYSHVAKVAARGLLNVKERWFLLKGIKGVYKKARRSREYIDLSGGQDAEAR